MKITIDIEAIEVKQILDAILPHRHHDCTCHQPASVPESFTTAKKLIDSARKLDKAIEEAKPADSVLLNNTVLQCNTKPDNKLPETTKALPKTTPKKVQPKPEPVVDKPVTSEPKPGKAPACVKTWSQEELNLLRTCPSDDAARFVYASHFKDARSEGAIRQKWYKMNLTGEILRPGDNVRVAGENKEAIIQSFTDNRQCANLGYPNSPATYQTQIDKLTKVNRE